MIDLSVGVELTLEALSLLPLVSLSLRSAVASLLASLFATWPRCCLDDPDGAVPRQSARLARVLLTATACRRLHARERFRRDLFRCELSLAQYSHHQDLLYQSCYTLHTQSEGALNWR